MPAPEKTQGKLEELPVSRLGLSSRACKSLETVGVYVVGDLVNTDITMNQTFWIGIYPGLCQEQLDYVAEKFEEFFWI